MYLQFNHHGNEVDRNVYKFVDNPSWIQDGPTPSPVTAGPADSSPPSGGHGTPLEGLANTNTTLLKAFSPPTERCPTFFSDRQVLVFCVYECAGRHKSTGVRPRRKILDERQERDYDGRSYGGREVTATPATAGVWESNYLSGGEAIDMHLGGIRFF
ncbi:hypothetical protein JTB14_008087 [Gonioctena quinquepunctata]|nr:hypothetical protein JTB14_008087 [Gonioctena quinquepunctata]